MLDIKLIRSNPEILIKAILYFYTKKTYGKDNIEKLTKYRLSYLPPFIPVIIWWWIIDFDFDDLFIGTNHGIVYVIL